MFLLWNMIPKGFPKTSLSLLTYDLNFSFLGDKALKPGWGKDEKVTRREGFTRHLVQVLVL